MSAKIASESTVIWGSALDAIASEKRVVVQHDPVVDADDCAVANGMVVRRDVRVTLREVAHVDQRLPGLLRDGELVEKALAPPRSFVTRVPVSAPRWAYRPSRRVRRSPRVPGQRVSGRRTTRDRG